MRNILLCVSMLAALPVAGIARAETRSVGPGKTYAKPCQAFAAAQDGDTIEIDAAGSYDGDVCAIARNRLTIRGVNGRAHIDAAGKNSGGKAIWVVQGSDTVVQDIELSGCAVPDKNGAGIRQEGRNLRVERCYFHDNENGILTNADAQSAIEVIDSEFAQNGAGDGQSHNMYIGEVRVFLLRGSYSHHGKVGHLVKSRALRNEILYNRLTDEAGTASYELDLPQGGTSLVLGNLFHKSASAGNGAFISYAREAKRNADSTLQVVSNTFVNARSGGTFVAVASDVQTVLLRDNVFSGPGTACDLASALRENNFAGDAKFVNAASYDYALSAGSPAIDHGVGSSGMLEPRCQYAHPTRAVRRTAVGAIDQGALEFGSDTSVACFAEGAPDAGAPDAGAPDAGVRDGGVDAPAPDAGSARDASAPAARDASAGDASGDAGAGGADASASEPTKGDGGCQGSGVGAQLWAAAGALLWALRRRRYAVR